MTYTNGKPRGSHGIRLSCQRDIDRRNNSDRLNTQATNRVDRDAKNVEHCVGDINCSTVKAVENVAEEIGQEIHVFNPYYFPR